MIPLKQAASAAFFRHKPFRSNESIPRIERLIPMLDRKDLEE